MNIKHLLILVVFVLNSCIDTTEEYQSIEVDPKVEGSVLITDLFRNIEVVEINCSDSLYFGDIDFVKSYGDLIFLHDQFQTKSLTVVNTINGTTSQLRKIGRGPGEYLSIDAFAYDEREKLLYIYERGIGFKIYNFPNFELVNKIDYQEYLMNIELISQKMIVFSERMTHENLYEGVQILDLQSLRTSSIDMPNYPATIELSYPNTVTRNHGSIYYASPGPKNFIYKISSQDEYQVLYSITFGKHDIPMEYWLYDEAREFESVFKEKDCATWVKNIIDEKDFISFSFLFKEYGNEKFVIFDKNEKACKTISGIVLQEGGAPLGVPAGTMKNKSVFYVYPEQFIQLFPRPLESGNLKDKLEKCVNNNNPALIICEI